MEKLKSKIVAIGALTILVVAMVLACVMLADSQLFVASQSVAVSSVAVSAVANNHIVFGAVSALSIGLVCLIAVLVVAGVVFIAYKIMANKNISADSDTINDEQNGNAEKSKNKKNNKNVPIMTQNSTKTSKNNAVMAQREVALTINESGQAVAVQPIIGQSATIEPAINKNIDKNNLVEAVQIGKTKTVSDDEVMFAGIDKTTKKAIIIRYNKSFMAKLIQSSDDVKNYYTAVKNALLSCDGAKSRVSWKFDSVNKGRTKLAKIGVRGKSLYLYLALNHDDYADAKFKVVNSTAKSYADTSVLFKINGPRKLQFALQLIGDLSVKMGLDKTVDKTDDYYKPFETTEQLLEQKFIKELVTKQNYDKYKALVENQDSNTVHKLVSVNQLDSLMTAQQATEQLQIINDKPQSVMRGAKVSAIVNVDTLSKTFADGDVVNLQSLKQHNLIGKNVSFVKVLARGTIDKSLNVTANEFSIDAVKMILLTGGSAIKILK